MLLGEVVSTLGILPWCDLLGDPYSVVKYYLIASACLVFAISRRPQSTPLDFPVWVYFVALVAVSVISHSQIVWVGKKFNYFTGVLPSVLVLACYYLSVGDDLERIEQVFGLSVLASSVIAIAQGFGYCLTSGNYFQDRVYAIMGSPVFLGGLLALGAPVLFAKWGIHGVIPLAYAAYLTQSRSGIMAMGAGLAGVLVSQKRLSWKAGLGACLVLLCVSFSSFRARGASESDMGRYHMARIAAKVASESPIAGIGPERFGWAMAKYRDDALERDMGAQWTNYYTHNQFLEALVSGGAILLLAHIFLIVCLGFFTYSFGSPGVFGAACSLFTYSLFQPTPLPLKAIMACLVGASSIRWRESYSWVKYFLIAGSAASVIVAINAIVASRIQKVALEHGNGNLYMSSYSYHPSSLGEQ